MEALISALSGVAQLHRHRCCFCSREAWRTAALGICVWLKAGCSSTFLRLGVLFISFPSAARGYLLSPLSFSRLHTLCVFTRALSTELLLSPLDACGWDAVVLESVCLLSRARHWCRNRAGTTHVVRPCFVGLQANILHVVTGLVLRDPSLRVEYLGWPSQSPLGCFAS